MRDDSQKLIRRYNTNSLQLRATKTDKGHEITGYAATFNTLSEELWPGVREKIAPNAFWAVLDDDVVFTLNHDDNLILGRTKSKTLELSQDDTGLRFKLSVPDTTLGRDVGILMERGDLSKMSFAFQVSPGDVRSEEMPPESGQFVDTIMKVSRLWDVALVTNPAYPSTSANFRAYRADSPARGCVDLALERARLEVAALDALVIA